MTYGLDCNQNFFQVEKECEAEEHLVNVGKLVEETENRIRNSLNEIYFGKTKDIVNNLRCSNPNRSEPQAMMMIALKETLKNRNTY